MSELASFLKGDLQMHTEWSDGSGSILEMAEAAEARGYEYIAITDHSKGLKIAGGINEDELAQQTAEIDAVNQSLAAGSHRVQLLRSVELNLNPHGEGDMDATSLNRLDIVLGCFHSALRRMDDQTDRYLAALRNPNIQILGHPRGRPTRADAPVSRRSILPGQESSPARPVEPRFFGAKKRRRCWNKDDPSQSFLPLDLISRS